MTRTLLLPLLLHVCLTMAGNAQTVELLDAHRSGFDVYEGVIRNTGSKPLHGTVTAVADASSGEPLPVWWTRLDPPVIPAGGVARLAVRPRGARNGAPIEVELSTGTRLTLDGNRDKAVLTFAVLDPDEGRVHAYFRNKSDRPTTIQGLRVGGNLVVSDAKTAPPGGTVCLSGQAQGPRPAPRLLFEVSVEGEARYWIAPLASTEAFTIAPEDDQWIMRCPTHLHGTFEEAAEKLFERAEAEPSASRTLHLCRAGYDEGLRTFSRCVETLRITPQGVVAECGVPATASRLYEVVREAKRAVEPGRLECVVELEQGEDATATTVSTANAEAALWAAIAAGAKGLYLRGEDTVRADRFITRLRPLTPLLALAEPTRLGLSCTGPYTVHALVCGEAGYLLVLLPGQDEEKAAVSLQLDMRADGVALVYGDGVLDHVSHDGEGTDVHLADATGCLALFIPAAAVAP